MSFLGRLSSVNSQNFVCSQPELLGKLFVMAVATAAASRLRKGLVSKAYPLPDFKIGDLVAEDWLDEFDENATDFGEVRGICYLPQKDGSLPANTWVYLVNWTRSTCGCDSSYPCYDGQPIAGDRLRLVQHR
jgi:hypothetical protein